MGFDIAFAIVLLIAVVGSLRFLDPQSANPKSTDDDSSEDLNVIYYTSELDLIDFTGKSVVPSDNSLIRKFDELNVKEMRRYAGEQIAAD